MQDREESSLVFNLTKDPGWKVLRKRWMKRKREFYEKLRLYKRDREFYQCQGKLNMIDLMFLDIDQIIEDVFDDED